MAALSAVLRLAHAGDHVVAGDDLYGGTSRLLAQIAPGLGVEVTHVDTARPECASHPQLGLQGVF
jgi:cystathionine beta-lyase